MLAQIEEKKIKDYVIEDYRTAAIFEKYGLDFCCRGNRTIDSACQEKGVERAALLQDLVNLKENSEKAGPHVIQWDLQFLADYIVNNHHAFCKSEIPLLTQRVNKIAEVHGARHPELLRIRDLFLKAAQELDQHMKKEELILFPYIKQLDKAIAEGLPLPIAPFGSVQNPIQSMLMEHEEAGRDFEEIRTLSSNYTLPQDACTTYRVTFDELKAFEEDLHKHVHLENYVLFPKAIELEQKS